MLTASYLAVEQTARSAQAEDAAAAACHRDRSLNALTDIKASGQCPGTLLPPGPSSNAQRPGAGTFQSWLLP